MVHSVCLKKQFELNSVSDENILSTDTLILFFLSINASGVSLYHLSKFNYLFK